MRIVLFVNNWVGWQITRWLKQQGECIAGLVIHPPARRKYEGEIIESASVPRSAVFDGSHLNDPDTIQALATLNPDVGLSVFFGYILKPAVLGLFPKGVMNLHPAYLPYNRGAHPNVWSIVEGTPAGVTIHFVDEGIDSGDVIARTPVPVYTTDTGETLYRRLEEACVDIFKTAWPQIKAGSAPRIAQRPDEGSTHRASDVAKIDRIDPHASYSAMELINILRARTFPPYKGAYFEVDGQRVYLRLQLLTEDDIQKESHGRHD
ncbi:MAG: formyl transferase [Phycisphaerae bacterium]|nr:formyl transferase [Phycisphaerae bacterium]